MINNNAQKIDFYVWIYGDIIEFKEFPYRKYFFIYQMIKGIVPLRYDE